LRDCGVRREKENAEGKTYSSNSANHLKSRNHLRGNCVRRSTDLMAGKF
jgi:hypothetical protein